jgi:hypothetical protein
MGTIDPALVGTPWRRRADIPADRPQTHPHADVTFAEAQRRKEIYLGKLRELESEVKSGRLVDKEAAYNEFFSPCEGTS